MSFRLLLLSCLLLASACLRAAEAPPPATPEADRRGEDQTFLTYPEWFLVYSPDEYADHLAADAAPSDFPWLGHLRQFWQAYGALSDYTAGRYAYNGEYHTMIRVIGVSTTIEYGLKGGYELLVGRITELTRGAEPTPEDRLSAKFARDYVDFLDLQPWYQFDFVSPLKALWLDTPWVGPDMLRKWERRYILTSEFVAKAAYARLIGWGAASSFDKPVPETVALVAGLPADVALPEGIKLREARPDGRQLLSLPRYAPFTSGALALSRQGGRFVEIAGNRDNILVTALAPAEWQPGADWPHTLLFRQPILTRPQQQRVAVVVPVAQLDGLLLTLSQAPFELEHVYDY